MRIGLLTLPLETGYGSILQAYALKTVLTRQGHEVILIRRLVKKKRFNGWNILKRSVKKYIFRKPACVFYDKKIYDEYPVITCLLYTSEQRCPTSCIVMREDEEGFLYPQTDTSKCIDCNNACLLYTSCLKQIEK